MDLVVALHAVAALLLVVAGGAKIARPRPTVELIETVGLPAPAGAVAALAVVEISVGVAALAVGGRAIATLTALFYLAFAVVVLRAKAVGASSCGCFGRVDAPPSWIHVVGNVALAAVSGVTAAGDRTPLDVMADQPLAGLPFVAVTGVLTGLAIVGFTALPEALAARAEGSGAGHTFRIDDLERQP